MSKKCTPLWREAHFGVKSVKDWRLRGTFGSWDVEKVHAVAKSATCSPHFWTLKRRFVWQAQGDSAPCRKWAKRGGYKYTTTTTTTLNYATLHYTNYITLRYSYSCNCNYNYHYLTLHYTLLQLQLHYLTLHYTRLRYTIPRYSTEHYSTLHYATLH